MNKTRQTFSIVGVAALLAVGAAIYAQESRFHGERHNAIVQEKQSSEREVREKRLAEGTARVGVAFEGGNMLEYRMTDAPVKGAPFSAQIVVENTQTLANGVHISSKSAGMLYRDGDGRTRSEQPREGGPEIVLINDPVARVAYHLHMFQQTAVKVAFESHDGDEQMAEHRAAMERKHVELERQVVEAHGRDVHSEHGSEVRVALSEGQLKEDRELGRERKVESLGTQTLEGVQAVGTRVTFTFPAGAEGNDQPFSISFEKWYSPDLQVVIMTRHNDPRSGDNVYRLTGINRSEPAHSLFEPPSNFALKEERVGLREK